MPPTPNQKGWAEEHMHLVSFPPSPHRPGAGCPPKPAEQGLMAGSWGLTPEQIPGSASTKLHDGLVQSG